MYGGQWDRQAQKWVRTYASDAPESWSSTVWDEKQKCWTGDVPGVGLSITADRKFGKPVLNTEFGYEYQRGGPTENRQVHHTDKVRRLAWRIVCAGGYFAAGFHGTIGHSDAWNRIDPSNHYTFQVKDEGAGAQLRVLYEFFTGLPFWRMQPMPGVSEGGALAEAGKVYVAYLPQGGTATLNLSGVAGAFEGRWFNPRTGEVVKTFSVTGGEVRRFEAPDGNDWVLLVKQAGGEQSKFGKGR